MSPARLTAEVTVPFVAAMMCLAPVVTRPTLGLLVLAAVSFRVGQGGSRLPGAGAQGPAAGTDRDDDRFWKAGLIYVNRDDPALLVGSRFGVGWTFNFANPSAWLVIAAIVAVPAGLAAIAVTAGL